MKKGQGISINVIIIAAVALAILVVLVAIFTGKIGNFNQEDVNETVEKEFRYQCGDQRLMYVDNIDPSILYRYQLPSDTVQGIIFNRPQYIIPEDVFEQVVNNDNPVVCDVQKEINYNEFNAPNYRSCEENTTVKPDSRFNYPYDVVQVLCCWGDYCYKANESLKLKYVWTGDCECREY
ncbi:hypothetical protein CMI37_35525 [Candidatus Pacearchaeota archaeon]|nr:hypothetical protein [Candidatus Pacearchaeota archaeon]|tara:strand:+ start:2841 stop:3377 length:537 start_codon:yes stop_codon:yes gene_type:complete